MPDLSGSGTDASSSGGQGSSSSGSALDWFNAASPLIGDLIGGGRGQAGPMPILMPTQATQNIMSSFDSSKWTVSTGKASANANADTTRWLLLIGASLLVLYLHRHA
jgi:hypothetical protein